MHVYTCYCHNLRWGQCTSDHLLHLTPECFMYHLITTAIMLLTTPYTGVAVVSSVYIGCVDVTVWYHSKLL